MEKILFGKRKEPEMSRRPTLSEVENAFQPAREINDPERFAGRHQAVLDCYYALVTAGANIAIIGNRGIGKTSLARQVAHMAKGDNSLLHRIGHQVSQRHDFVSMYLACGDTVQTAEHLLERLLTSGDCLRDWIYDIPKARREITAHTPKFSAGVLALGGEKKAESESQPALASHSTDTIFTNVVRELADQKLARDGILIVVDEFDRISQPAGFASFLKSL